MRVHHGAQECEVGGFAGDGDVDEPVVVEHLDEVKLVGQGQQHVLEVGGNVQGGDGLELGFDHFGVVGGGDVEVEVGAPRGRCHRHTRVEVYDGATDETVNVVGDAVEEVVKVVLE